MNQNTSRRHCEKAIDQLMLKSPWGPVAVAGGRQFRSLWVRDFCMSVPGLLTVRSPDEIAKILDWIWQERDPARKMLVRGLDVMAPQWRVMFACWGLQFADFSSAQKPHLFREFLGEHKTPAFDSNLFWILARLQVADKRNEDLDFVLTASEELLEFYQPFWINNQLHQAAFSDWQDSVRREGPTFYLHLLFWRCLSLLQAKGRATKYDLRSIETKMLETFWIPETGLFRSQPGRHQMSLESNLWACEWGFPKSSSEAVLASSFFKLENRGCPVDQLYPTCEISWSTKMVGLRHYHDDLIWSWLWAEQVRFLAQHNQVEKARAWAEDFFREQDQAFIEANGVAEIYRRWQGHGVPVRTWIYKSEAPFLWGASKWLEALQLL